LFYIKVINIKTNIDILFAFTDNDIDIDLTNEDIIEFTEHDLKYIFYEFLVCAECSLKSFEDFTKDFSCDVNENEMINAKLVYNDFKEHYNKCTKLGLNEETLTVLINELTE